MSSALITNFTYAHCHLHALYHLSVFLAVSSVSLVMAPNYFNFYFAGVKLKIQTLRQTGDSEEEVSPLAARLLAHAAMRNENVAMSETVKPGKEARRRARDAASAAAAPGGSGSPARPATDRPLTANQESTTVAYPLQGPRGPIPHVADSTAASMTLSQRHLVCFPS
jgi:hypothetical protein